MLVSRHSQRGFSLLEVLIAVMIVSVGFLAAARMQIEGMRASQNAYFVSQANFMVREMTDRMRANTLGVIDGHYQNIETSTLTSLPGCVESGTECSPAQIASADLAMWSRHLHPSTAAVGFIPTLPSSNEVDAKGTISYDADDDVYTVSVEWSESMGGTGAARSLSVQVFP